MHVNEHVQMGLKDAYIRQRHISILKLVRIHGPTEAKYYTKQRKDKKETSLNCTVDIFLLKIQAVQNEHLPFSIRIHDFPRYCCGIHPHVDFVYINNHMLNPTTSPTPIDLNLWTSHYIQGGCSSIKFVDFNRWASGRVQLLPL